MKIFLFLNIRLCVFSKRKTVFRVLIIASVSSFAQCVLIHLLEDAFLQVLNELQGHS